MKLILPLIAVVLLAGCAASGHLPAKVDKTAVSAEIREAVSADSCIDEIAIQPVSLLDEGLFSLWSEDRDVVDSETVEDNELLSLEGTPQTVNDAVEVPVVPEPLYDFPVVHNSRVQYFIDQYTGGGRLTFSRWLKRSTRYLPMMRAIFADEGLPKDLAYLAMVESGFNPRAYSWAHAVGPWQFISSTADIYHLKQSWWVDERRDFEKSTRAAARFLKDLSARFSGNWYLAVAAYNAGGGRISKAVRKHKSRDFWVLSRGKTLRRETRDYVPKLLAVLHIAKNLKKYGFDNLQGQEELVYDKVSIPAPTDLELVAELCGVNYTQIKDLNPELLRWSTPPNRGTYMLNLPQGTKEKFLLTYRQIPRSDRARFTRYKIKRGDTLLALAHKYHVRVGDIRRLNKIKNVRALRIGKNLILPMKQGQIGSIPVEAYTDDYNHSRRHKYKVRSGDSLWKISRRFSISEKQLRVWNRMGWSNLIKPGQVLYVSNPGKKITRAGSYKKIIYQVRAGDSLWKIGRRFKISMGKIQKWNNLSNGHILQPGDKLTLLVSRT